MMNPAKPVSLSVKPFQVSHLCFEVDGILETSTAQLGAAVATFDFPAFYAILGSAPTVAGDPSRLRYDFLEIESAVAPFALAALRKEDRKAALNKAINARQNAYYAKYGNAPAIISLMNKYYSPLTPGSKPQRLDVLSGVADNQFNDLKDAYTKDKRLKIVRTTSSVLTSETQSFGDSTAAGRTDDETLSGTIYPPKTFAAPPASADWPNIQLTGSLPGQGSQQLSSSDQTSVSTGVATQIQSIVNTDYGYRTPFYECQAQLERAKISLMDQYFAQFMAGQNLPNLARVFQNELSSIDGDVFRLQIAFLNAILMSPIAGIVTGLYKYPGDAVKAGEPVVRIEDNNTIYLMATVIYRGPIVIGSSVTVETSLFDASPLAPPMTGSV